VTSPLSQLRNDGQPKRAQGAPRKHPITGPPLDPVKPLAAAQHRRLSHVQKENFRRRFAPVVARFVAPFILPLPPVPPPSPPPAPPKPHVYPPGVTFSPTRVFLCDPSEPEGIRASLSWIERQRRSAGATTPAHHGYGSPRRVSYRP